MARGRAAQVGDETINANGYVQVKTEDRGWVAKHVLMMEENLGRKLNPGEYVSFRPDTPRNPVKLENLQLRKRGDHRTSHKARIAQIDARIEELTAEREHLIAEEKKANV